MLSGVFVSCDKKSNDGGCNQNGEHGNINEEEEEESMVPFSNTIANPGTVMIEFGDADVAAITVLGSWWPEDVAGGTIPISTRST